jgi:hypothetical protein
MNKNLGWLLYAAGVCLGAFGGTRIPVWWPVFAAGVVTVIIGTLIIRKASKAPAAAPGEDASAGGDLATQRAHLKALHEGTAALDEVASGLSLEEVRDRVETLLLEQSLPFGEGRQVIIDRQGIAAFAEIMGPFASGERYLNRAWSCAVDEHAPECLASLSVANGHFTEAEKAWAKVAG